MFRESCTYEIFKFLLHQYFLRVCTKLNRTSVGGDSTEFTKLTVFWTKFVPREMKTIVNICVGKFRPRLIELTSFKSKLLIKFIINKTC